MPDKQIQKFLKIKQNPALELFKVIEGLNQEIANQIAPILAQISRINAFQVQLKDMIENQGIQIQEVEGIKGDKGDSPTKEELLGLIKPLIPAPIKGDKGDKPIAGIDFQIPKDGHTPTDEELINLIMPLIPEPIKGEDGKTPTKKEIADLIVKEFKKTKPKDLIDKILEWQRAWLPVDRIIGLNDRIKNIKSKSESKIVKLGGGGFTIISPTGNVNGDNTEFVFPAKPKLIISDGAEYREGRAWSISGLTVTMTIPPVFDIYGKI